MIDQNIYLLCQIMGQACTSTRGPFQFTSTFHELDELPLKSDLLCPNMYCRSNSTARHQWPLWFTQRMHPEKIEQYSTAVQCREHKTELFLFYSWYYFNKQSFIKKSRSWVSICPIHNSYPLLCCTMQRNIWTVKYSRDSSLHRSQNDPTVHVLRSRESESLQKVTLSVCYLIFY
jgi:hypothetical protein